jgi:hypothetical protein
VALAVGVATLVTGAKLADAGRAVTPVDIAGGAGCVKVFTAPLPEPATACCWVVVRLNTTTVAIIALLQIAANCLTFMSHSFAWGCGRSPSIATLS